MPRSKTIEKVVSFLNVLKQTIKNKDGEINLTKTLKSNKIPHDYGKILCDKWVIYKAEGGARGTTTYEWNNRIKIDDSLAEIIISEYNRVRKEQFNNRGEQEWVANREILLGIQSDVKTMLAILNPKNRKP